MASRKKKNEFIEKQIKIKQEFADKVYKKMRADRYGLTFCCPNELLDTDLQNYTCNWQNIKYEPMPEEYKRTYSTDPIPNYCAPPGVFNAVTGLCDVTTPQITGYTIGFTYSNPDPNGTAFQVTAAAIQPEYGRDCPIIFDSLSPLANGAGGNARMIIESQWWTTYDATPTGPFYNPNNPNVDNISFVNALGKRIDPVWGINESYYYQVAINVTSLTTYYIGIAAEDEFGFSVTNGGVASSQITGSSPGVLLNEISNSLINNGQIVAPINNMGELVTAYAADSTLCVATLVTAGNGNAASHTRLWIYPITLDVGCNIIKIRGENKYGGGRGMVGAVIWDNTLQEIVMSTARTDLTEIWSSEEINYLYQDLDEDNPWVCASPSALYTASPYTPGCPACRMEGPVPDLVCPEGYIWNENTQLCETTLATCDTETIKIEVVDQNGDPMSNYDITFDGGNYRTDDNGKVEIVIQQASINTEHMLNMCHCITTAGGCAVQDIKITVTNPDAETCIYNDPICKCQAPAVYKVQVTPPAGGIQSLVITFQDLNLSNTANTIESYILEYRDYTVAGDGVWTEGVITKPGSGTTFTATITGSVNQKIEYRIKTKCTDSESKYSAIYNWTSTNIVEDQNLILWYDFTDASSMFTNLAGTTNVANDGDPVRRVNNKSTSTNKLGVFARDMIGSSGYSGSVSYTESPKYDTSGANGYSFLRQYRYTGGGTIINNDLLPLVSRAAAGYGGIDDGVRLSNLASANSRAHTSIMVVHTTEKFLNGEISGVPDSQTNYASIQGRPLAPAGSGTADPYFYLDFQTGKSTNNRPTSNITGGAAGGINSTITTPSLTGPQILIRRTSTVNAENIWARNVVLASEATAYNMIMSTGIINDWNVDFTVDSSTKVFVGGSVWEAMGVLMHNHNISPIYEMLVWDRTVPDVELDAIVKNLKIKYGII